MELKDQLCSYDQGLKLFKLGIKCTSYWKYMFEDPNTIAIGPPFLKKLSINCLPAYSVAELMEMVPCLIDRKYLLRIRKRCVNSHVQYNIGYLTFADCENLINKNGENLASALANVLIWLIQNNHIDSSNLKL
jgi:hypothetical protein